MNDRIVELETRLTFQEAHLEALGRTVGHQQRLIDGLRLELEELRQRLKVIESEPLTRQEQEPPPHF